MRIRPWPVAVALLALAGVVLRVVVLNGRWGTIDSDEAVVGLMARDVLDGSWRAFYWGQHYAGTQETALVALFGASRWALKLVPAGLCAVASVLTWRVGRRFLPERSAQVAALLTWVGPGAYVWWSTKERGFYWVSLVLGLVLVLFAQRIVERGGRPLDWGVLGLAAGLGFWCSPTVAYFAVPAGIWLVARRRPPIRWLPVGVAAAVVGMAPWLWHNVEQSWASFERPPQPESVTYLEGLTRFFRYVLPMALNLRVPIDVDWAVPVAAIAVYVALGVAIVVRRPPLLLGLALVAFPLLYAVFPGAWFVGEGRYGLFALPFLGLGIAWVLRERPWVLAGVALLSVGLSVVSLDHIGPEQPEHVDGDLAALRAAGVDHVWADYWIAYRLGFQSGGWLVASSHQSSREPTVHRAVAADPTPAFLYARGDRRWEGLESALDAAGIGHRRIRTPHFDVVLAEGRARPASLPEGTVP